MSTKINKLAMRSMPSIICVSSQIFLM